MFLNFKIYQPETNFVDDNTLVYGFEKVKNNDLIGNIFTRPETNALKTSTI